MALEKDAQEPFRTDEFVDLKGEVCPYAYVKSWLALEQLVPGQVLQVELDHLPAVEDVPRTLAGEGHEVLEVRKVSEEIWRVSVRKR